MGGLEDVGNFREGYCFRIKSQTKVIWNFCADNMVEKTKWLNAIRHAAVKNNESD